MMFVLIFDPKLIKLISHQAAQLGFNFKEKRASLHLLEGPVEGPITEDNKRKKPCTQRE